MDVWLSSHNWMILKVWSFYVQKAYMYFTHDAHVVANLDLHL